MLQIGCVLAHVYARVCVCVCVRACVFVEMGIFVLMKNAESQLNK